MRHLETFLGGKTDDFAREKIQPLLFPELLALGKQQLKAQTNPQEGFLPADDFSNGSDQSEAAEVLHAGLESANARQHHAAG